MATREQIANDEQQLQMDLRAVEQLTTQVQEEEAEVNALIAEKEEEINEYSLTIFQKKAGSNLYEKTEEIHHQKVYSLSKIQELLEESGLVMVECLDEKMDGKPREDSERDYIVAMRQEEDHEK